MKADAIGGFHSPNFRADLLNNASDLVAQRERKGFDEGLARPVMGVRMADTSRFDPNQDIVGADRRCRNFLLQKREAGTEQANGFQAAWV